ncbi:MAG: VanW family protein [Eggerthellaceae bacterium]|nr:VanW family protein [Eggerthellaceae bacterium]
MGGVEREGAVTPAVRRRNFSDLNPVFYKISERKEILRRSYADARGDTTFASEFLAMRLHNLVSSHSNNLIKRAPGVDLTLQENKAVNIAIASATMHGLVVHPGETFSFWNRVGNTTRRKGYLDGRVIVGDRLEPGRGGGLCNLANTIHRIVLHSPLTITEFHSHSDALAPDEGPRVPFATGTAVSYNYIDYRFRNDTDQDVQLLLWCEDETLHGQLRSEKPFPCTYELEEEGHCFRKEPDGKFYRVSKIYRVTKDRESGEVVERKLLMDNHSEVMYDYSLIPQDQIVE